MPIIPSLVTLLASLTQQSAPESPTVPSLEPYRVAAAHILILHEHSFDPRGVTRTMEEALARAQSILEELQHPGADFTLLCKKYSDDLLRREQGGYFGTFRRGQLADDFRTLEDTLFALEINEISRPVSSPLGIHILRRLPLRDWSASHILVQYQGARNAPASISRRREEAHALSLRLLERALQRDNDFASLARRHSDAPDRVRGGYLGVFGPHEIASQVEDAIRRLKPGQIDGPVESPLGFHIIRREAVLRLPLALIVIHPSDPSPRARKAALSRARMLRQQAAASEAEFSLLAREHSDHPSSRQGGLLGAIPPDSLPPQLVAVARRLRPGEVSPVTDTAEGFAILLRLSRPRPGPTAPPHSGQRLGGPTAPSSPRGRSSGEHRPRRKASRRRRRPAR